MSYVPKKLDKLNLSLLEIAVLYQVSCYKIVFLHANGLYYQQKWTKPTQAALSVRYD